MTIGHGTLRHAIVRWAQRLTIITLPVVITSCDILAISTSRFIVRVDSISAPDAIGVSETLSVVFRGSVGADGCSRIARVERRRTPNSLDVAFHGERTRSGECTQMPVSLDHEEQIAPPLEDPFTVRVLQPSGPALEKLVQVR
jgi:hypothetical protein